MVSGTLSLPSRGTFHHSLTVLSTIGHQTLLGLPDGPGRFTRDSTNPALLGKHHQRCIAVLHLRDSHPLRPAFPDHSARPPHTRSASAETDSNAPQPRTRNTCRLSHGPGLASSAFARHYSRNHSCFLQTGTEMFHFPATPPAPLYIQEAATGHHAGQVPPFGHPGITVQLATPPGLSRPHTSFIGHPAPRHPPCALHNLTNTHRPVT